MKKNKLIVDMKDLDSELKKQGRQRSWVATVCKVSAGQVSYWFSGERNMTKDNLEILCEAMDCEPDLFLL